MVGASVADVRLDGAHDMDIAQRAVALSLRRNLDERWFLGGAVGVIAGGSFEGELGRHDLGPGLMVAFDAGRQWLADNAAKLFFTTTATLTLAAAPTYETSGKSSSTLIATDLRLDATFGITLWNVWSPYLSARPFGGPFFWEVQGDYKSGSDPDYHTFAIGSTLSLADGLDVGIDWGFHGARGLSVSAGVSW